MSVPQQGPVYQSLQPCIWRDAFIGVWSEVLLIKDVYEKSRLDDRSITALAEGALSLTCIESLTHERKWAGSGQWQNDLACVIRHNRPSVYIPAIAL